MGLPEHDPSVVAGGGAVSVWSRAVSLPEFPTLQEDASADCVIVGGGVTGLGLAVRLAVEGLRVIVVERRRVGSGTTGATTAHLTHALDTPWDEIVSRFGVSTARHVAASVSAAIDSIEEDARRLGWADRFERVPGYRVAETPSQVEALEREAQAVREIGLPVSRVRQVPAALRARLALRFEGQAEIDPLVCLAGLLRTFVELGGRIVEESPVADADDDGVTLASGVRVRAGRVVHASHTPVGIAAAVQTRLTPWLSYVVAARLRRPLPAGLYWDAHDPYHYVRGVRPDRRLVLVGGEDHRVGARVDGAERFEALEAWARARLDVEHFEARWTGELFEPNDGLPFIGAVPGSRTQFVATGFDGTGITFGTVAAIVLADLVAGRSHAWQDAYRPSRFGPWQGALRAVRDNLETAWHFVADRWRFAPPDAVRELGVDSGCLASVDGRRCAVYRDLEGTLHLLSPRCTHMGCTLRWNDLDKTWDCPCHGGRFHRTGKVLYGPPTRDLEHLGEVPPRSRTR